MGFGRLLSSIGVGAATVDTKLEKGEFVLGEEVRGLIEIEGGDREQEVTEIFVGVEVRHGAQADSAKPLRGDWLPIEKFPVAPARTVKPGSREEIPFSFYLPYDTPLSLGHTFVWLQTWLDVERAFDPSDFDLITVRPNPAVQTVFDATERLGFHLKTASIERVPDRFRRRLHSIQELEFVPRSGEFEGRLSELELLLFPSQGAVDLVMEVDRRGLGGESYAQLSLSEGDLSRGPDHVAEALAQAIRQRS